MGFKEINDHFKQLNKDISGLNKGIKQQQKANKQRFNDSTLSMLKLVSDDMKRHNASDQSIKLALKGTYEYFKVVGNAYLPQTSIHSLLHHENQAQQSPPTYSAPLSEIEAKDINWLWKNRIPQGKITVLEGDPGMGKSLLAIDIAAHISTGQQIIKALQSSKRSLNIKEIAEITGLNYKTLRMTLSRMHEAGLIAHPYRGTYTTLDKMLLANLSNGYT